MNAQRIADQINADGAEAEAQGIPVEPGWVALSARP